LDGPPADDNNVSGDLDIRSNVTVVGAGAATTILQGGGLDRVVEIFTGATVTIEGVTIADGILTTPATGGAGIRNAGKLTLRNCIVRNNVMGPLHTDVGGGIYNDAATASFVPTVTLYNTVVSSNKAEHGGGVANDGALNVTDSAISGNSATLGGGIVDSSSGSTMITRSTIDRNSATYGGGLYMSGALAMSNCTVSGNVAKHGSGGALWLASNNVTIGSCTIHGNAGGTAAGWEKNVTAMYVNSGMVSVRATIFDESMYNATTGMITNDVACKRLYGTIASQGYNIDRGASCQFATLTDQWNTNAKLDPNLANNGGLTQTHALLPGSPAIGAIPYAAARNAGFVPSTDQRGVGRPQVPPNMVFAYGSLVADIGAFEYVYPVLPTLITF
jgi:hypothetical protein